MHRLMLFQIVTVCLTNLMTFESHADALTLDPHNIQPVNQYFKGVETNYKPDGTTVNYSVQYYCHRTVDQASGIVNEHTLLIFQNGRSAEFDTKLSVSADQAAFVLVDPSGNLTGEGRFIGTPWSWTGMTAVFKRINGMRTEDTNVIGEDFITGLKKDFSAATLVHPAGELLDLDVAILRKTSQEEFDKTLTSAREKRSNEQTLPR